MVSNIPFSVKKVDSWGRSAGKTRTSSASGMDKRSPNGSSCDGGSPAAGGHGGQQNR